MGRVAILKIGQGDFNQGFEVSLEIKEDSGQTLVEIEGRLPANPDIEDLYQSWEQSFARLTSLYRQQQKSGDGNDSWEIDSSLATNIASSDLVTDCRQKVQCLETNMQRWLQSPKAEWQKIRERLAKELNNRAEEIRLIVKAKKAQLWKLPWHTWNLLSEYPDVGVGYSPPEFKQPPVKQEKLSPNKRVRIFAVLGDSQNIDLEADRQAIKRLKDTETVFLEQPSSRELIQKLRDKNGWHIFFFAGHSRSDQTGRIYLNQQESLTIDRFKNALQEAIALGLKIAIFNSCDGLGLAQNLADLHIPVTIVMREVVADKIAQSFVREFLSEYTAGQPLYTAVRRAQARLEEFTDVPGATWLPLIFQNPAVVPPSWQDLLDETKNQQKSRWSQFRHVSLSSLVLTGLVMGIRWFGLLQPLELWTYDRLMQWRAGEVKPDPRLLIVTVDGSDLGYQDSENMNRTGSLSDEALSLLLDELETLHPTTIGLDIFHQYDFAPALASRLSEDNRFFAICKARSVDNEEDLYGVPPPREIPPQNWGFSDVLTDKNDVVRRHLLTITPEPTDPCSTQLAFSSLVALHYLSVKHDIEAELTTNGEWQIGNVVFQKITDHSSGYQGLDGRGYQILLNYRFYDSSNDVARRISLQEVLKGIPASLENQISEPIVIIGTIDKSYRDYFHTPYGEEIPGVFLQAQMISQILSAVLDQRSLLWWWNGWIEALWVWGWSIVGGILALFTRQPLRLVLNVSGSLVGILAICFVVFSHAGWIPLVPVVLALVATAVAVYTLSPKKS